MEVKKIKHLSLEESGLLECDFSFLVSEVVAPPFDRTLDSQIKTSSVPSYRKSYGFDEETFDETDKSGNFAAIVSMNGKPKGYVVASKSWNNMVSIDDIALDVGIRGSGSAKSLIQMVRDWAKKENVAGLRAETQSNNVSACHLYRSCGFVFGGYDEYLYRGIAEHALETALYWYLLFEK